MLYFPWGVLCMRLRILISCLRIFVGNFPTLQYLQRPKIFSIANAQYGKNVTSPSRTTNSFLNFPPGKRRDHLGTSLLLFCCVSCIFFLWSGTGNSYPSWPVPEFGSVILPWQISYNHWAIVYLPRQGGWLWLAHCAQQNYSFDLLRNYHKRKMWFVCCAARNVDIAWEEARN